MPEINDFWSQLGVPVGDIAYFDQYAAGANAALDQVVDNLANQYRAGVLPPTEAIGIAILGECGLDVQENNPVIPYLLGGIYAMVRLAKLKVDGAETPDLFKDLDDES